MLPNQKPADDNYITLRLPKDVLSALITNLHDEMIVLREQNEWLREDLSAATKKFTFKKSYTTPNHRRKFTKAGRAGVAFAGHVKGLPTEVAAHARAMKKTLGPQEAIKYIQNWRLTKKSETGEKNNQTFYTE